MIEPPGFLQYISEERNDHYQEVENHTYSKYTQKHTLILLTVHTYSYIL